MIKKRLLYLNLSIDNKDVSLGFTSTWLEQFSQNYDKVDLITLNKGGIKEKIYNNVNVYGISENDNTSKLKKILKIRKIIRNLTTQNNYELCFSHMSPLLSILVRIFCVKNKPVLILWYSHPGPKEVSKKFTLLLSLFLNTYIVTASKFTFPYKSKKVFPVGTAINYKRFFNKRHKINNYEFLILGRITKSKNLEFILDNFLESYFQKNNITLIGEPVTKADKEFQSYLIDKYSRYKNVKFNGMVPHKDLPNILQNYSFHINGSLKGSMDKTILETISAGIFNIYINDDYDQFFDNYSSSFTNFSIKNQSLKQLLNKLSKLEEEEMIKIVEMGQRNVEKFSIETIHDRIISIVENQSI